MEEWGPYGYGFGIPKFGIQQGTSPHFDVKIHFTHQLFTIDVALVELHVGATLHASPDQELFLKKRELSTTEIERQKNTISVGWYSREDMKSQLKWNAILV